MPSKKWPLCQICGKAVSTKQGVLTIYKKELALYKKQNEEWEKNHPFDDTGVRNIADFQEMPDMVPWHWGHSSCLGEGMYWIDYDRFNTVAKALSWTLHLMEKNWLDFTDWEGAVTAHHKVPQV